ncbi:MAG: hypothetical protein KDK71_10550 [Chlamydiia bacterium]|nr:hypothetical protein [Chlamydiia bacterium]
MGRPTTTLLSINNQSGGWDQTIDDNMDTLRSLLFVGPAAILHVHWDAPSEGSTALSTFAAASYAWCIAIQVDVNNVSTNGRLIYSDGTNWRYQKSNNIVTVST